MSHAPCSIGVGISGPSKAAENCRWKAKMLQLATWGMQHFVTTWSWGAEQHANRDSETTPCCCWSWTIIATLDDRKMVGNGIYSWTWTGQLWLTVMGYLHCNYNRQLPLTVRLRTRDISWSAVRLDSISSQVITFISFLSFHWGIWYSTHGIVEAQATSKI